MNATLFKASGMYADLRSMGLTPEEICDIADWAETHTEEIETIEDYITPDEQ